MFHLFRKDIEKHCAYCKSGSVINEGQVICSRRGVPPRPATLNDKYTSEDFSL